MNTVDTLFNSSIDFDSGKEFEVTGILVVSLHLTYLCSSEENQSQSVLIIAPNIYDQFRTQIPIRGGSMVGFVGRASIKGKVTKTGMGPLPLAFYKIFKLEFQEKSGEIAHYTMPQNDPQDFYEL